MIASPHMGVARAAWLLALPLVLLPWLNAARLRSPWPWLGTVPPDRLSASLDVALRGLGSLCILLFVGAAAGLFTGGDRIERISRGAHIVLVIDRSSSMNDTFAGRTPAGNEESKAAAARRLLEDFINRRFGDRVGMVAFSTAPMFVLPLTDHREAIRAAIDVIDRPGLAYTDVARGLAMALSLFESNDGLASHVVVLVSDGAAVIDRRVQEQLRAEFATHPVRLYWLFLRTQDGLGIFDLPPAGIADIPQEMPERHLNIYFQSLGVPYRAFEAADAAGLARAIEEIDRRESAPIRSSEAVPRHDLSAALLVAAALGLAILILAKLAEVQLGRTALR